MNGTGEGRKTASITPRGLAGWSSLAATTLMIGGLIFPAGLQAQVPTGAQPGVVDKDLPQVPEGLEQEGVEIEGLVPTPEKVPGADEVVATLTHVTFRGMTVVGNAELQAIAAPYLNRPVTRGEIAQLKFDIARLYYDRGYILVRVVTPPQSLSGGVLDIAIYEARIGRLDVENNNVLRPYVVDAFTSRVRTGTVFNESTVESMVNDFNDLNNVDATLNLRPGADTGTSDMILDIVPSKEDEQSVSVDNYGSELTGNIVGAINLEKSNLLHLGEKIDIDATVTDEKTYSVSGALKIPIGFRNVMFDVRAIRSQIEIGDRLSSLNADGETDILDLGLSSRLINMRRQIAEVRIGVQAREHEAFSVASKTDDDIRQVTAEGSYLARFPNLLVFGSLRLAKGVDVLNAADKGEADATRIVGDPETYLVQPLVFANLRPVPDGELTVQISGQYATDTVLSSDLFILGGFGSVRGFEPAETTGDSGVQFSVEYSHTFWSSDWQGAQWTFAAGPFIDGGKVFNRQPDAAAGILDDELYAAGVGAELSTGVSRIGESKLRFDLAFPLGSYDSTQVNDATAYLRFVQKF